MKQGGKGGAEIRSRLWEENEPSRSLLLGAHIPARKDYIHDFVFGVTFLKDNVKYGT